MPSYGNRPRMTPTIVRNRPTEGKGQSTRPFSALPHDILRDRRLIPTDVAIVAALLVYARSGPACWPAVRTLAHDVGRSRRTVQLSLARLRAAGWIADRPDANPTGRVIVLLWRQG